MSRKPSKPKKDEYEPAADSSRSEEEMRTGEEKQPPKQKKTTNLQKGVGGGIGAGFVGFLIYMYVSIVDPNMKPELLMSSQYEFKIYCPINKMIHLDEQKKDQIIDDSFLKEFP